MKKLISCLVSLLMLAPDAYAQTGSPKTAAQLNTEINTFWLDNGTGLITPFNARQTLLDLVASFGLSGTTGQVLVGVTGSAPVMATMSQDCSIVNTGAITCLKTNNVSLGTAATANLATLGVTSGLNSQSGNYPIVVGDCGKTIVETGGSFVVTLPAPTGFPNGCTLAVNNGSTTRGQRLAGFPVYSPAFLYAGQEEIVQLINSSWVEVVAPGRYKITSALTLFTNQSTGSDTLNDGLDVTAPKQTLQQCLYTISNDFDFFTNVASIPLVTCKLGANDTTGVHFGPQGLSGAAAGGSSSVDGNGFSISNSGDTDDAIHLFFGAVLYISNLTIIAGPANHSGLSLEHGANAFIKAGDTFTGTTTATNHMVVRDGASVEISNNYNISGPAFAHAFCTNGGSIRGSGAITATVTTPITVVDTVLATAGGVCDFSTVTFAGSGVTGQRFQSTNAVILSKSGTPQTSIPGSAPGVSLTNGSADNIVSTQMLGTSTNDAATAGNTGELLFIEVLIASEVTLTTGTAANVATLPLTAGDWDVYGNISYDPAGTTTIQQLIGWTSLTSAAFPTRPNKGAMTEIAAQITAGQPQTITIGSQRISLAAPTNVFLSTFTGFGVSTLKAYGYIAARRRR